ncbi:hypothetical protein C0J52_19865 [Blattella germanica]|nr:hypothetical protein C0J52_19865 [Blattella germanica]
MTATFVFNKLTVAFAILTLNYSIAVQETPYKNITIPEFDVSCHSDSECLYFLDSSCKTDPEDGKTRCLCGDMSQPRGRGSCRHSKKGLHRDCDVDEDCIEGAICKPEAVVGFPEEYKACQCMECYFEMNYFSGLVIFKNLSWINSYMAFYNSTLRKLQMMFQNRQKWNNISYTVCNLMKRSGEGI